MKFAALAAAAALFGASTVSASAAVHGHQDVALHRRGADRIQRLTKRAQTAALLAVQNSTSTNALSTTAIWWAEDGWTGSCGVKIDNDANTVGLPLSLYPNADAQSGLCGQTAYAVNPSTGQSVSVVVVDGSDRSDYATFSKAAYLALGGNLDTGMLPITLSLSKSAAKALVADASSASSSSSSATVSASAKSATSSAASVRSGTSSVSSVAAPTTKATTTEAAPTTTVAPTTTTQDQVALAAAASSSKAFEQQQSLQLAAQASSSSQAAAAYAASQAAASQAAASQVAASEAAAASAAAAAEASQAAASKAAQEAAAAAAASKASADAAWASSSSAAAAAAKATQNASSGGGSGNVYSGGIATFFYQNGIAGNCGTVNSDDTLLVALPTATYAGGSHCGQYVEITRSDTGNKIKALVADSCPTCNNNACLDLSWGAFSALGGTQSMGVFDITWQFV